MLQRKCRKIHSRAPRTAGRGSQKQAWVQHRGELSEESDAPVEESNTANTAVELSVKASTQTTETPELKITGGRSWIGIQCKKQQQEIEQLREQLLKVKKDIEEEVAECKNKNNKPTVSSQTSKSNSAPVKPFVEKKSIEGAKLLTRTGKDRSFLMETVAKPGEHKHKKQTPGSRRRKDNTAADCAVSGRDNEKPRRVQRYQTR